jgi:hypothetical protein
MNECTKVERLIHLHREGERTAAEDRMVLDHAAHCGACSELLRAVEKSGAAIAAARNDHELVTAGPGLVGRTVDEIRRSGGDTSGAPRRGWPALRPAAAFGLLCAVVLVAQQGRDAWESENMERRLASSADWGRTERVTVSDGIAELAGILTRRGKGGGAEAVSGASVVPRFLTPGFGRDDLFRAYAEKFPALAGVDPYDGIDDREREVLATEGKMFLEEFRMLIKQGERR